MCGRKILHIIWHILQIADDNMAFRFAPVQDSDSEVQMHGYMPE